MIVLESGRSRIELVPEIGARITSFRTGDHEFLWRNPALPLRCETPGSEYDPNFFGGIDELMPNDSPEVLDGVACPDHGEVWTLPFDVLEQSPTSARLCAQLPRYGFRIERKIVLDSDSLATTTTIRNLSGRKRPFLWKLHPALAIEPGDEIVCAAKRYAVADPAWSRRIADGDWTGESVPSFDGTTEFLYLFDLTGGHVGWRRGSLRFDVDFDPSVFPHVWYFASYGGFQGHHVAVLEPCTARTVSVADCIRRGECSVLAPDAEFTTTYTYRAWINED